MNLIIHIIKKRSTTKVNLFNKLVKHYYADVQNGRRSHTVKR